ncbi:MAG TPA: hypothetical protein VFM25_12270 [Verrucomicrobiae bacterium]|nr:hypothetical protein [Verrucomicrobiae bacterium]
MWRFSESRRKDRTDWGKSHARRVFAVFRRRLLRNMIEVAKSIVRVLLWPISVVLAYSMLTLFSIVAACSNLPYFRQPK